MKKKLLGILIIPALVMAGVTGEGSSQTKAFEKNSVVAHNKSALEIMYSGETTLNESFNQKVASEDTAKANNYSALDLMHEVGTGSTKYAKSREVLEEKTIQGDTPLALKLMYSKVS